MRSGRSGVAELDLDRRAVMAAAVIMTLPNTSMFFAMQNLFIGGLTAGATKG